jgi:hypothetical protein
VTNLSDHDPGSLRDTIATTPDGGTVDFQPGLSGTITLTTGELDINKDLTIEGPGADVITVSGNYASRVLNTANLTVVISGLTIADGMVTEGGGGIYNSGGKLIITGCTFSGNASCNAPGGGIINYGTLTITDSTFSGNSASFGGAIYNFVGTLNVTDSTFSGNSASGPVGYSESGGGIDNGGRLTITDSAFSHNSAVCGGGIFNYGTLTITDSTFRSNSASGFGSSIDNFGTLTTDSSFSANSANDDYPGGIFSYGLLSNLSVTGTLQKIRPIVFLPPQPQPPNPAGLSSDQLYVGALYRDILGRQPDVSGLNFWVQQLQNGVSRTMVAQDIVRSNEHLTAEVTNYYQVFLNRAPDLAGLTSFVSALQAGFTEEQIVLAIVSSPEFLSQHRSSALFVNALYNTILGRNADAPGLAAWTTALDSGELSNAQVAMKFVYCGELRRSIVDAYYLAFLGRSGDGTGELGWLTALQSNQATLDTVAVGFLASSEYANLSAAGTR